MIAKLHDLCLVLVLFSAPLLAGDVVSLNIKGKIVAAPCQISSDSVARTISLTDSQGIRASSLYTPGSATEWVPFDFNIERCPAERQRPRCSFPVMLITLARTIFIRIAVAQTILPYSYKRQKGSL